MTCSVHTLICLLITLFVACYCSVTEPQLDNEKVTYECYGTNCYYESEYTTGKTRNVNLPKNLTDAVLSSLPVFEASQRETIDLLHGTLVSQENILASQTKAVVLQEKSSVSQDATLLLLNKTVALLEKNGQHLENIEAILTAALTDHQMTATTTPQPTTEEIPPATDCQDIAASGYNESGPYVITPPDGLGSFEVFCDFETENKAWTVFQKRIDGSVDFFRNWTDYEHGFGNISGEYWLGLTNIHRLTSDGTTWTLQIDFEDFYGYTAYASYDSFAISDAASNYTLSVGEFSGTSGDSLKYSEFYKDGASVWVHHGMPFTTRDRDNDADYDSNCADQFKGGWWYNDCLAANLNGLYLGIWGEHYSGIVWYTWKEWKSLQSIQMKMRRV